MLRMLSGITALSLLAILGCSKQSQNPSASTPTSKPAVQIIPADDFLVAVNSSINQIKSAPTTLLKDEAKAKGSAALSSLLQGKILEAVVTVQDIKMHGASTARLSIRGVETPKLGQQKNVSISILGGTTSVDLPMSLEAARTIEPGQKLVLRGVAKYESCGMPTVIMPWPKAFIRICFTGLNAEGALVSLSPTEYAIVAKTPAITAPVERKPPAIVISNSQLRTTSQTNVIPIKATPNLVTNALTRPVSSNSVAGGSNAIPQSYVTTLDKLISKYASSLNKEAWTAARKEKQRFLEEKTIPDSAIASKPDDLKALQLEYQKLMQPGESGRETSKQ